jgi:hypothetical protein
MRHRVQELAQEERIAKRGGNPTPASDLAEVADLRHKLWLQFCFNDLDGLGQDESLTLEDPEEHYRIEWFIENLRECKPTFAYFGLTLDSLLTRVILPEKDKPIFLQLMQEKLVMPSTQERITDHL